MLSRNLKLIDFENIENKFKETLETLEWKNLTSDFLSSKKVYLIGNGGLHFVAAHGATDCTRLIKNKVIMSFDSCGHITSYANDNGYENIFLKWLESTTDSEDNDSSMVIGLSCSGNSKNITRALTWAKASNFKTALISGQTSKRLEKEINEVVLNCKFFHTCEVLTLILFYQLIHEAGSICPSIIDEVKRKDPWSLGIKNDV